MDIRALRPPVEDGPWPPITHLPPIDAGSIAGAVSWTGLSYSIIDGYRPMVMDVHVPVGLDRAPIVMWVHGGGWVSGDRRHVPLQWGQQRMFERLIAAGFAVATPDYRLVSEAPLPAPVQDLVAAIRYLRRYAPELSIDADRIALWGDSAGAHLATTAGLAGSVPDPDHWLLGESGVAVGRADVTAIIHWYGVSDFTVLPELQEFVWPEASPEERTTLATRCSPVTLLRPDSPPLLIMHGDRDGMAPLDQSIRLADAAETVGSPVELVVVEGADHVFLGAPIEPLWDRAIDFLHHTLRS